MGVNVTVLGANFPRLIKECNSNDFKWLYVGNFSEIFKKIKITIADRDSNRDFFFGFHERIIVIFVVFNIFRKIPVNYFEGDFKKRTLVTKNVCYHNATI